MTYDKTCLLIKLQSANQLVETLSLKAPLCHFVLICSPKLTHLLTMTQQFFRRLSFSPCRDKWVNKLPSWQKTFNDLMYLSDIIISIVSMVTCLWELKRTIWWPGSIQQTGWRERKQRRLDRLDTNDLPNWLYLSRTNDHSPRRLTVLHYHHGNHLSFETIS